MTLDLSHQVLLDQSEIDRLPDANGVREHAQARLHNLGVFFPPAPNKPPRSFTDTSIPLLTNNELIEAYTEMVSYAAYMGEQYAYAKSDEKVTKQRLKGMLALLKEKAYAKGYKKVEEVNAIAQVNAQVLDAAEDVQKAELFAELLGQAHGCYTDFAKLLSRSIETRKMEFEQNHRSGNMGKQQYSKQPLPKGFGHRQ